MTRALLTQAVKIIEAERKSVVDSFTNASGNHVGKVTDPDAKAWIRRYDRFLRPARAHLGKKHG